MTDTDRRKGEAPWERDKRVIGHWCIVTDAYRPKAWCANCWEAWPCPTAKEKGHVGK